MNSEQALNKIRDAFNKFDKNNMDVLDGFYAKDAVFQDPVVKVEGLDKIKIYYGHVYSNVKSIQFEFSEVFESEKGFALPWTMTLAVKGLNGGRQYSVEGSSIFQFDRKGKVIFHRDYVDLGAMVYERIPIFGKIINQIRKMLRHQL